MIELIKAFKYDNNYDYIKTFNTRANQDAYFNSLNKIIVYDHNYIKENENTFKVPFNYDYLVSEGVNYILFNNGYKDIYAFIIEKHYVSEDVTRIIFEIDVIQTYMFDFTLDNSFIERKVCNISELTTYDEGLNIGEHIIDSVVCELQKEHKYYAMFNGIKQQQLVFENNQLTNVVDIPSPTLKPSTIIDDIPYPIHFMPLKENYDEPLITDVSSGGTTGDTDGGIGQGNTGDFTDGYISGECLRFIKGFEGYAPNEYQDVSGYWTICYGVTKHGEPDIYETLKNKSPVSEEEGAKISYDLKNQRYAMPLKQRCVELGITKQHQFDALVSFAYNLGTGKVLQDNALTRAIKNNITDEATIRQAWEQYAYSNGVFYEGLYNRRKQEVNMFFNKPYEIRKIPLINSRGGYDGYVTENNGNGWLPS